MSRLAPIALFAYRRPRHLRLTLDALRGNPEAAESDLWIFSDAARDPGATSEVTQVRAMAASVSGFKSVRVIERSENLGLARSIIDGVTRLCEDHGRVIVLEDDLVVSPDFLGFMNRGLDRYADDERVMQISGFMFPVSISAASASLFLNLPTSWGWACWQRSWAHFDAQAKGRELVRSDAALRLKFDLGGAYDYSGMLEAQAAGKVDSWAIRWYLSVFLRDGLVLYPRQTLVQNTGIDGSGTHGAGVRALQAALMPTRSGDSRPAFPQRVEADAQAFAEVQRVLRAVKAGLISRLIRRLAG